MMLHLLAGVPHRTCLEFCGCAAILMASQFIYRDTERDETFTASALFRFRSPARQGLVCARSLQFIAFVASMALASSMR